MCFQPYKLKELHPNTGEPQFVPCGKCPPCKARIISSWSFRLRQEEKTAHSSHFVTLTYDTSHVPISPLTSYMTLNKKHVPDFIKRLRKRQPPGAPTIKYFAVGEYGSKNYRPHYHLIIFNAQPPEIIEAWRVPSRDAAGKKVYCNGSLVTEALGNVFFGHDASAAAIGYCLKYIQKEGRIPMHRNDDRVPEFRLMSKALGISYITMNMYDWHHADELNRMHCVLEDGRKIAMPRYYKDWIYQCNDQRQRIADHAIKMAQERQALLEADMYKRYGDNWTVILRENQIAAWKKMFNDAKKRKDL